MADQYFAAIEAYALGAAAGEFVLDIASASGARRINVNEISVSFNGTTSSATPVLVRLVRTTTAPTAASTPTAASSTVAGFQSATPIDPAAPTSTVTAYAPGPTGGSTPNFGWTTPPTFGAILRTWYVSPTAGVVLQFPLGQEPDGPATAGAGLGIWCNAPAAVTVNAGLVWTE